MNKIGTLLILIASSVFLLSCEGSPAPMKNLAISRDEFDHVEIHIDEKTLKSNGYTLGDSINFKFSNGYEINNVPFFDGYYGKKGDYMFVVYPGYPYPVLTQEFEKCIIDAASLDVNVDTVTLSLNKKEAFIDEEETFSIVYSNTRSEYDSDKTFANYRNIAVGNIKPNRLYRSASPCNNDAKRATFVSDLMEKDKIDFVFDLSNNYAKLSEYASKEETPQYWKTLYNKNQVFDCKISYNFYVEEYYSKIKLLCDGIIDNDGKYLFHCFEGKDRTGFLAILLEALCGASLQEIETDYFVTFTNYYKFSKETDAKKYNIYKREKLMPMVNFLLGRETIGSITNEELFVGAKEYLTKCGLSNERITLLINRLTK